MRKQRLAIGIYKIIRSIVKLSVFGKNSRFLAKNCIFVVKA